MPQPIAFADPADVELAPAAIHPDRIIEGTPQACAKCVARSADGTSSVVVWSCTIGRFQWLYSVDETLHIISGEVFVADEKGAVRRLGPGDVAYFPAGSRSVWHVTEEVKKLAVCRHSMPPVFGFALRVWNKVINRLTGFSVAGGELGGRPATHAGDTGIASA
jgi:uncharacterized cupin superfamily protein